MAAARLPHDRRDDRPRRPARRAPGASTHWKAQRPRPLADPATSPTCRPARRCRCVTSQDHGLDRALDNELIARCAAGARAAGAGRASRLPIRNVNRTVGTMLGYEVTRALRRGRACPTTRSASTSRGSAGQSFGAFLPRGITLTLEGDANDYVGKGLSGGSDRRLPAARRRRSRPRRTSSSATSRSTARPAARRSSAASPASASRVRNSGAHAVVEGVGDHGCEYMTGGRVVVLGRTGRNFAAGMSGGIAYVLDADGRLRAAAATRAWSISSRSTTRTRRCCGAIIERHIAAHRQRAARDAAAGDWAHDRARSSSR